VLLGPDQITRAGHQLTAMLAELSWTPSQRALFAGQVEEEAVVRVRPFPASGSRARSPVPGPQNGADDEIRVSIRVVAGTDPLGGIGSLTLWIDWAALADPLGVRSARGAASALVALVRDRQDHGLRVIQGEPGLTTPGRTAAPASAAPASATPGPTAPASAAPGPTAPGSTPGLATRPAPGLPAHPERPRSPQPSPAVLWWRRHRRTTAGSVMAGIAVVLLLWVAENVLHVPSAPDTVGPVTASPAEAVVPVADHRAGVAPATGPSSPATGPTPTSGQPVISVPRPADRPTVQAGTRIVLQSDVLFETGSTRLSPTAMTRLQQIATTVRARDTRGTIQINGYTDDIGPRTLNRSLSEQRATSVARALQTYLAGSSVVLLPQGFGESAPVRTNTTPDGRQLNRRVTVVLPTH